MTTPRTDVRSRTPEAPLRPRRPASGRSRRIRIAVSVLALSLVAAGWGVESLGRDGFFSSWVADPLVAPASPSPAPGASATRSATAAGTPSAAASARAAAEASTAASGGAQADGSADWRLVYRQDFDGSALPSGWGAYHGQPGGNPGGWWDPDHVAVADGKLLLHGYEEDGKWATAGVMRHSGPGASQTYGKYEVRFRVDRGHGVKYVVLLWPTSEVWPRDGEIDFAEDGGGARKGTSATLHYGEDRDNRIERKLPDADFSQWHTVGVEWSPGRLTYTLDGQPWSSVASAHVPDTPMNLAVQTEAGTCGDTWTPCPDSSTPEQVTLQVDWVTVYAPPAAAG